MTTIAVDVHEPSTSGTGNYIVVMMVRLNGSLPPGVPSYLCTQEPTGDILEAGLLMLIQSCTGQGPVN